MSGETALERKAAQLCWITVHGGAADAASQENVRAFGVATPAEVIVRHQPGGIVLFAWSGNTEHPTQVARLTDDLRAAAAEASDAPLAVAIDEEGGRVTRLPAPATRFPSARAVAAALDPRLALERWKATGVELAAVGVTTDLAPVVDLANPWNPVVGDRAFGDDPREVAAQAALAVRGLAAAGIGAVAKHFPGHGATAVDSHAALPEVGLTRRELEPHLDAFRRLLDHAAPAGIMPGHLLVRALDATHPATVSRAILTGLLREELGYEGAIVTDSLAMAGIRGGAGDPAVAVAALAAGADVLLMPPDLPGTIEAVCRAVRSGVLSEDRIDEALARARRLVAPLADQTTGVAPGATGGAGSGVGAAAHADLVARIARQALRIETAPAVPLPLEDGPILVAGVTGSGARVLVDALTAVGRDATLLELPCPDLGAVRLAAAGQDTDAQDPDAGRASPPDRAAAQAAAQTTAVAVAGALEGAVLVLLRRVPEVDAEAQDALLPALARAGVRVVLIETGATPAPWWDPTRMARIRTHDVAPAAVEAAAGALVGESRR